MKSLIKSTIENSIAQSPGSPLLYREPLIGYALAEDPIFDQLPKVTHSGHLLPKDLLPQGKSVLAFFVPFTKEVILENQRGKEATRHWAETYVNTNTLIEQICLKLKSALATKGVKLAWLPPTYQFNKEILMAQWSHKHVAFACGLGSFGLNHLLITPKGCGGRFGSAVVDVELEPSIRLSQPIQCFNHTKGCSYCLKICPVNALGENNFDRHKCFGQCVRADEKFTDLPSAEVCGKCSTGPCAYIEYLEG